MAEWAKGQAPAKGGGGAEKEEASVSVPQWWVAGSIWLGLGLVLIVFGLLFVLEAITYYERQPPITFYIRTWDTHHWVISLVVGLALVAAAAAAFTHFVADARS